MSAIANFQYAADRGRSDAGVAIQYPKELPDAMSSEVKPAKLLLAVPLP